jgi:8-oxo-dGTP diphosphatase
MNKYVGTLLYDEMQRILLQLRDDNPGIWNPGYWNLPGGRVEAGENELDAVKREFIEETGYPLKEPRVLRVEVINTGKNEIQRTFFYEAYDGKQPIKCNEGQDMRFFSRSEIDNLRFVPDHLPIVEMFYRNRTDH